MKKLVILTIMTFLCTAVLAQKESLEKGNFRLRLFRTGIVRSDKCHRGAITCHSLSIETYSDVFEYLHVKVKNGILQIGFKNGLPVLYNENTGTWTYHVSYTSGAERY